MVYLHYHIVDIFSLGFFPLNLIVFFISVLIFFYITVGILNHCILVKSVTPLPIRKTPNIKVTIKKGDAFL